MIDNILKEGELTKVIVSFTMSLKGQRIEAVYSNGVVNTATLVTESTGRYEVLGLQDRSLIAKEIEKRLRMTADESILY